MRIIKSQRNIAASYMPPNPYDIGPSDPKEYKVADTSNYELNVQFDDPIIIYDDGDFEFTSDKYNLDPAPDSIGEYKDEEYNVNVIDADTLYDIIYDQLIQKHVTEKYPSGKYRVTGIITLQFDIDGVEYDDEFYGIDEDGDPDYSRDYYADNADATLVKSELTSLNITAEINSATDDIYGATDAEYEDDIQEIGQEFTSENTSINSNRLPAVFNMVSFEPGTVNIDYGGGKFDNVAEYLTQYDVVNLVYDPYNRTAEHNKEVIRLVREHGGADTATCSNVLNVIKEPEVRINVLNNIKKLVKPNGKVYITVYEGKGNNAEGPTKAGYQLNRKTAEYMDEIQQVFPDAKRKGKLIVATNSGGSVTSATNESCYDNNILTTL